MRFSFIHVFFFKDYYRTFCCWMLFSWQLKDHFYHSHLHLFYSSLLNERSPISIKILQGKRDCHENNHIAKSSWLSRTAGRNVFIMSFNRLFLVLHACLHIFSYRFGSCTSELWGYDARLTLGILVCFCWMFICEFHSAGFVFKSHYSENRIYGT